MSEKQEHRKRWQAKVRYAHDFDKWLRSEPPMLMIFSWLRWKKERPVLEEYAK